MTCTITGTQKQTDDPVCVYIRNAEQDGEVQITTISSKGDREVDVFVDGKELIKAIQNAMNV